ncbi:MAG: glycosyltransferase family 2 protein [Sphingomonadales bacterium]|nr:glycosyltransferase family 2 protein [Sphingomonadales bacterium]
MNFPAAFLRLLFRRPGEAMRILGWWLAGKRVRARNRLHIGAGGQNDDYDAWIATVECDADEATPSATGEGPLFAIWLVEDGGDAACTRASIAALNWPDAARVAIVSGRDGSVVKAALAMIGAEWVIPVAAGTRLAPLALRRFGEAIADRPEAQVVYGDHDQADATGRRTLPWFKPLWNPDLFLAQDYLSQACAIAAPALASALDDAAPGDAATIFALLLAITSRPDARVVHVPHVLAHLPDVFLAAAPAARMAVLERHFAGSGATFSAGAANTVHVSWPLPAPLPLVSVIVPTRDNLALARACVDSVLSRTGYRPLEIIIVDNGSVSPGMLAWLDRIADHPAVRVLRDDGPFNFSAINNRAARVARGDYLCLLNDDTEVREGAWLAELMRHAVRPDVGAVGARLVYGDGSIQHAGVTIGLGGSAGHAHRFQPPGATGWFHRADVTHAVSAVTGACLVVARRKFEAVGGLDETAFAVAFNDVDLCLKLQRAGWRTIYEPRAMLTHHESKSRDRQRDPARAGQFQAELAELRRRWQTDSLVDPLFHPRLDRSQETYRLKL